MRRRHHVDIERAGILEFEHHLHKALRTHGLPRMPLRDIGVLAIHALKRAIAEEDGAAPRMAADARFLPKMEGASGNLDRIVSAAYAHATMGPVGAA